MVLEKKDKFFWGALAAFFCVGLSYPLSIYSTLGSASWSWIQNIPAFNFFILFILPIASGLFAQIFSLRIVDDLKPKYRVLAFMSLGMLVALAALLTWQDAFHSSDPIPPHMIRQDSTAMGRAGELRRCMPNPRDTILASKDKRECAVIGDGKYSLEEIRDAYKNYAKPFSGLADWVQHRTSTAVASLVLTFIASEFLAVFFWYCLLLVLTRSHRQKATYDAPAFVLALLLIYFPTRVYSAWYINLYSLDALGIDYGFVTLVIIAVLLIFLFTYLYSGSAFVKLASGISTVFTALFAALAYLKPEWLWYLFGIFEEQSPVFLFGDVVLIFVVLLFVAISVAE